jgi:malate dehydrogenase (oxaloacetate-decarboxylating)
VNWDELREGGSLAAAHAIAGCFTHRELSPEYIVPSVFNRAMVQRVAAAVTEAATKSGMARKGRPRR